MIADAYPNGAANARSVYVALTEIASDRASDTFDSSHPEIANRAGMSVSSVRRILPTLEKLGKVKVRPNAINGIQVRSTYTIIREHTPAHGEHPPAQLLNAKRTTEEEMYEESFEGTARRERVRANRSTCSSSLAEEDEKKAGAHGKKKRPDLIARSTRSATEANVVTTTKGERFNVKTGEYEW